MTERNKATLAPQVDTLQNGGPSFVQVTGFKGFCLTLGRFALGVTKLQEMANPYPGRRPAVSATTGDGAPVGEVGVRRMGFGERLKTAVENIAPRVLRLAKIGVRALNVGLVGIAQGKLADAEELDSRGNKMGFEQRALGVVMSVGERIRGVGVELETKWNEAKVIQIRRDREKIRSRYLTKAQQEEIKREIARLKAEEAPRRKIEEVRRKLPEEILTRAQLREQFKPLWLVEEEARKRRKELKAEAMLIRKRIDTKQAIANMLIEERDRRRACRPEPFVPIPSPVLQTV